MTDFFHKVNPAKVAIFYVTVATWLVMGAWFMQIFFDIRPCELCLWQRIPMYVVIFGAVLVPLKFVRFTLMMQAVSFFTNVALSSYHSGIERKWWEGLKGCSSQDIKGLSIEELHQQLINTAIVKCDEISWSLFGLSLTNYNFIICLSLGLSCLYCLWGYHKYAQSHYI
jgi:disulfide bond formation protein DsbB